MTMENDGVHAITLICEVGGEWEGIRRWCCNSTPIKKGPENSPVYVCNGIEFSI